MLKPVVLLNMGAARTPPELKTFLYNMFTDQRIINSPLRYILSPIIAQTRYKRVWKKYELIGGSRLYDVTERLSEKLSQKLNTEVTYAMRYTKPFINEVLTAYQNKEIILLPLYPQYSTTTIGSSLDAFDKTNFQGKATVIEPFYKNTDFNRLIAGKILKEIEKPQEKHLIFSAHGLPQKIIDRGDPYQKQLEAQVDELKKLLPQFKSIQLAYQSRFGNSPWLQPYLDDTLEQFKDEQVVIYPISFMIDNSETDLELKMEYAKMAKELGIQNFEVVSCPNDDDDTVNFLADLIRQYND